MAPSTVAGPRPVPLDSKVMVTRHSPTVRVTHWLNVLCLSFLLLSGLQIFNAHPALYWGHAGADNDLPVVVIGAVEDGDDLKGVTRIGPLTLATTGVLGASDFDGERVERAFPSWLTIPSYTDLSAGRRWHFFFAWLLVFNGSVYLGHGFLRGHFARDLKPTLDQLAPAHLAREIIDHVRLRFPKGDAARGYNVLQKLAYLGVIVVLLPMMVATGLTMSPGFDAAVPSLVDVFGGRQSARTVHFLTASFLVAFVAVHVVMVLASGVWNNMRSMVTGRYAIEIPRREA
jgi:thiosulfate reductase cytochrome b subunit